MAYLGKTPSQATRQRYYFTASGSETSVSGADDNSNTLVFTDGNYIDVILNGSTLVAGTDYNTTTANTVSGLAALSASDIIEIVVYDTFSVFGGNVNGDFNFGDNNKAIFGAGSDLQIYHDGTNSYIDDAGTGGLNIRGASYINLQKYTGETMALFNADGAVELRHNNATKFATTASGISVTGAISSNKGSAGTLATFTDGVNSNFVVETSSLLTTIGNGGGSASLAFKANNTEAMRINSSGNVGIGTASASQKLTISGTANNQNSEIKITAAGVASGYIGSNSNGLNIGTDSYGIVFKTGVTGGASVGATGTERMRISTSGEINVAGKSSNANNIGNTYFHVQNANRGHDLRFAKSESGSFDALVFYHSGSAVGYISYGNTSTSYNTSSDYRLKENVADITGATDRLKQLNPVRFNFIADADTTVDGFIAHEVATVIPEAISGEKDAVDDDGNAVYQGIDQSKLVPLLVATIQELEARITALENV